MANCKNGSTDRWDSKIIRTSGNDPDGYFVIREEDETTGKCLGRHVKDGVPQDVEGRCTGKIIWLLLPASATRFIYVGEFDEHNTKIKGVRFSLTDTPRREDALVVAGPDEWTGEKVLTFLAEQEGDDKTQG